LRLDRRLADGESPASDPALGARAAQLSDPVTQRAIGTALANVLDAAEELRHGWAPAGSRPPAQCAVVDTARDELEELIAALNEPGEMSVQGIARAARLAWDPASPISGRRLDATVGEWARAALAH
jgi:hypothetical protein